MSMMLTFRAGKLAALVVLLAALGACSREQQDWRSAEAADTVEGYGQFLKRHPDSELATEARTRVAQLSEDLEWQRASSADNADAYKQFLAQHPNGKWAQEARIRMENFALGREGSVTGAAASGAESVEAPAPAAGSTVASSGEAAQAFPGEAARAQASAQASPGELARAPTSAQALSGPTQSPAAPTSSQPWRGESAQAAETPTSTQASPGEAAQAPGSPLQTSPPAVAQVAAPTQASPTISTAWRSNDGFGVQLGAFTSESAATSEWQQLTARFSAELGGLAPRVVSANTSTGRLFRLQALVADEARARALCDVLKKQAQACVPVLPH
jgi:hypothetical protein